MGLIWDGGVEVRFVWKGTKSLHWQSRLLRQNYSVTAKAVRHTKTSSICGHTWQAFSYYNCVYEPDKNGKKDLVRKILCHCIACLPCVNNYVCCQQTTCVRECACVCVRACVHVFVNLCVRVRVLCMRVWSQAISTAYTHIDGLANQLLFCNNHIKERAFRETKDLFKRLLEHRRHFLGTVINGEATQRVEQLILEVSLVHIFVFMGSEINLRILTQNGFAKLTSKHPTQLHMDINSSGGMGSWCSFCTRRMWVN